MSVWETKRIEQLAEKIGMGPFGSNIKVSTFVNHGIPVISGQHLKETRLVDQNYNFVTLEHAEQLKGANVFRGDVIFTHAGNIGNVALIPEDSAYDRYVLSQRQFYLRCDRTKLLPEWITYFFKSREGQFKLLANASSTGVPSIAQPATYLKSIEIAVPSLPEQKSIVEVLNSLEDKIDLLNRQNKTLESLTESLFRQWFFEEPNSAWTHGKVNDLFILQRGFDLPTQNRRLGPHPIFSSSGIAGYHDEYKVKAPGVTTGRSGLIGKVFYARADFWPLNTSLFVVEYKLATPLFTYFFLKTLGLEELNAGSAVPTLNRNDVHSLDCVLPDKDSIAEFEKFAALQFEKIADNTKQLTTLVRLRDELLPKLMSGEASVES